MTIGDNRIGRDDESTGTTSAGGDHGSHQSVEIIPVRGLPRYTPGIDIAETILAAAPGLLDNDILVVTSKIISKSEGRIVSAPTDPEERDNLRRELVEKESVRVLARKNRTLITENRLGIVQAAAGIDGSNVSTDELALLPSDPDASARALRTAILERAGIEVGVVITDTMGRAWRIGQTDFAIGSAGLAVSHAYEGSVDNWGNPLVVTEIAIADEIAAAADLVKGKLHEVPVAIIRGLDICDNGSCARDLVRSGDDDLFWLGTAEALEAGRRQALLMRRSVREFSAEPVDEALMYEAFADALTAPAPHHTQPVRFFWVRDRARRHAMLDAMAARWRADLASDGLAPDRISARLQRGDILYRATELVIPVLVADGAHDYPDSRRQTAEQTMFTVAVGAAVQGLLVALAVREVGSCWIGSTIFAPEPVREALELDTDAQPLGAIAIGYPLQTPTPRPAATTGNLVIER